MAQKQRIIEGRATIDIFSAEKISKELPVFYNPVMKMNRDISILFLNSLGRKGLQIADPLAGSGVRAVRFLKEVRKGAIESIATNDGDKDATALIKSNMKLNKIASKNVSFSTDDASLFLLKSTGFDYIDIDPFGSPVPFLDAAIKRLSRNGILALTATDTAPLCGTYPQKCQRRYWATPKKGPNMHETALRILIRRAQLIGTQYEKALVPLFCYAHEHYLRVFLHCEKSNAAVDSVISQLGMHEGAGPLWLGPLWDAALCARMAKESQLLNNTHLTKFLATIANEANVPSLGFFDLHDLSSSLGLPALPKREAVIFALQKKGYKASGTHFSGWGVRTNCTSEDMKQLLEKLN
jgi:tRNA (guanine26-N2/guanine27-N2)-dimethyltransferase